MVYNTQWISAYVSVQWISAVCTNLDKPLQNNLADLFLIIERELLLCHKDAVAAEKLNVSPSEKLKVSKCNSFKNEIHFFEIWRPAVNPYLDG